MTNQDSITPRSSLKDLLLLASAAKHLSAADRRVVVSGLFEEALYHPTVTEAEIFTAAYGEPTGGRYWSGWLEDDFSPLYQFVEFLEAHRGKKSDIFQITRSPILEAIGVAARSSPDWLKGDISAVVQAKNHPQFLAGCEVRRGSAIQWLSGHSEYSELLPPLIAEFLRSQQIKSSVKGESDEDRGPGRPTSMHLIAAELRRRAELGHPAGTIESWAKNLSGWHRQTYPNEKPVTPKAIKNSLAKLIKKLGLHQFTNENRPKL